MSLLKRKNSGHAPPFLNNNAFFANHSVYPLKSKQNNINYLDIPVADRRFFDKWLAKSFSILAPWWQFGQAWT